MTPAWLDTPTHHPHEAVRHRAQARQRELTKPPGSLGRLEAIAVQLAALQNTERPGVDEVAITVFAADHGIAAAGVSAFPQTVTAAMLRNFATGGAAISVLARELGARLEVINLGTVEPVSGLDGVMHLDLGPGTADFRHRPAMTQEQLYHALEAGRDAVRRAHTASARLFIGGEMGIGNTTAATALACAFLDLPPARLAGPGTGLDPAGVSRKIAAIETALAHHRCTTPLETLRRLGGFEIAALTGAYVGCAQLGLPVLVDGFIASVAALAAVRINSGVRDWLLFAHVSAEPGHRAVLDALGARPLLDLGLRLGEGSGAAVAVPLLRLACALHNGMATFAEAQVPCR